MKCVCGQVELTSDSEISGVVIVCNNKIHRFSFPCYAQSKAPTLRPWKPEEVPVGALIRSKIIDQEFIIMGRNNHNHGIGYVEISALNTVRGGWQILSTNDWEYSLDYGKTWLPCGILE